MSTEPAGQGQQDSGGDDGKINVPEILADGGVTREHLERLAEHGDETRETAEKLLRFYD